MRAAALFFAALAGLATKTAHAREVVDASEPTDLSVTIYRDPLRVADEEMNRSNPQGFAMISETRMVTLPAGASTIRFVGVAEGMVGVSAIVSGLPGGTIEKNRNAELLSPAALVNGTLGNRVTITRSNPATGLAASEEAIVRSRADGGLVLQTGQGFEAVRCAGLPEKLTFKRVPAGLSAKPVYSVDTTSETGGSYEVTLTYLSWGFDWRADYVATLGKTVPGSEFSMRWLSWLTLLNDNDQSFHNATLQVVAGALNIESDFERLAEPPVASPLQLDCYPIGSTSKGVPVPYYGAEPPPAPPVMAMSGEERIVVTAQRRTSQLLDKALEVTAAEENLGDLKLFRAPMRVDVSAKGLKQVAFLDEGAVKGRYLYRANCDPYYWFGERAEPSPAAVLLVTRNDEEQGLGVALPQGRMSVFEQAPRGGHLAASTALRDFARGQDIELYLSDSGQVFSVCGREENKAFDEEGNGWVPMRAALTNANRHEVSVRVLLSKSGQFDARWPGRKVKVKNGYSVVELRIPPNATREFRWKLRNSRAQ